MRKHPHLVAALLSTALFVGAMTPLHAQTAPATPGEMPAAHPWASLDPAQRDVLAPLQKQWDQLPPRKQANMLQKAQRWVTLPPGRREKIRERIARWQQMTPEQRQDARANERKFRELPPAQRQRLHNSFERYQQLPPAERERLMQQWRELPPAQRRQWIGRRIAAGTQRGIRPRIGETRSNLAGLSVTPTQPWKRTSPACVRQLFATSSSSKSGFSSPSCTSNSTKLNTLRAYISEACSGAPAGRLSGPRITTPPCSTRSPGRVSSQLPPLSAARSTISAPGFMPSTIAAVRILGAGRPGTAAVLTT